MYIHTCVYIRCICIQHTHTRTHHSHIDTNRQKNRHVYMHNSPTQKQTNKHKTRHNNRPRPPSASRLSPRDPSRPTLPDPDRLSPATRHGHVAEYGRIDHRGAASAGKSRHGDSDMYGSDPRRYVQDAERERWWTRAWLGGRAGLREDVERRTHNVHAQESRRFDAHQDKRSITTPKGATPASVQRRRRMITLSDSDSD
jgi:hypothetical protein